MDNWLEINARLAAIEILLPRMLANIAVIAGGTTADIERLRTDLAVFATEIPITGDVDEAEFRPQLAARLDAIAFRALAVMDDMRKR